MKITVAYNSPENFRLIFVEKAEWMESYKINIFFNDGCNKVIDFKDFLFKSSHPEIAKYKDINLFRSFKIIDGNINWNNYDLIFPIVDLYNNSI
ncbi:DUF2442 domain-containing protein [bacterium]|nr:DUF2442 domain-containing protein [bacterium]